MTIFSVRKLFPIALMLLFVASNPASADGLVTGCTVDTEPGGLAQALAGGGVIRFACPHGSSIRITGLYQLVGSTLIDGGGTITLDGHGAFGPIFFAASNTNTILRGITLRGFSERPVARPGAGAVALGRLGGAVLTASGDAELDHVTIETSVNPINVSGIATVKNSTFIGNRGFAIATGTARVDHSQFNGNDGAILMNAGWVRSSTFIGQTDGAIRVSETTGPIEIRHSTFSDTHGRAALSLAQRAIGEPRTVAIRANIFRNNDGGAGGGAIALFDVPLANRPHGGLVFGYNYFVLGYNYFVGNRGARGGAIAADLAHTNGMVSTADLFVDNVSIGDGGAVAVAGGVLRMSHALFKGNRAGGRGAALALDADAQVTLANALVVGNESPHGAITGNAVSLNNVTIADNIAAGLVMEGTRGHVANAIFAHNHPSDCAQVMSSAFKGSNMQSDGSCPGVAVGDAYLDAFYIPAIGSPALRAGDRLVCAADPVGGFDLPFQGRLDPTACALGAFERPPVRKFSRRTDRRELHATVQDDFSDDEGYRPPPVLPSSGPEAPEPPSTPPPNNPGNSP